MRGRTLGIVLDASHVDAIVAARPSGVLCFDPDGRPALDDARIETWSPLQLLADPADVERAADAMYAAWRRLARIDTGGPIEVDPLQIAAYRHVRWTRRLASVSVPLASALGVVRPDAVLLAADPGGHALDRPWHERSVSILAGAVVAVARRAGVPVIRTGRFEPTTPRPMPSAAPAAGPPAVAEPSVASGHVLFIGDAGERARHAVVADRIEVLAGLSTVHVGTGGADGAPSAMSPDTYAGPASVRSLAGVDRLRDRFVERAAGDADGAVRLLADPALGTHLDFMFGPYARAVAANVDRWRHGLRRRRPLAVVASYPGIAIEVAAADGMRTVMLPHGPMMVGEDAYHDVLPSTMHIGAVGPIHRGRLLERGIESHRVRVTGVARTAAVAATRVDPRAAARPRILIPTGEAWRPSQGAALPVADHASELSVIRRIVAEAESRGWTVELRPHPRYDRSMDVLRRLGPASSPAFEIRRDRPLLEAAGGSTLVLFVGAPSSAIAEVARAGCPTAICTEATRGRWIERWGLAGADLVLDVAGAVEHVRRLVGCPREVASTRQRARHLGDGLLACDGGLAAAALVLGPHTPRIAANLSGNSGSSMEPGRTVA